MCTYIIRATKTGNYSSIGYCKLDEPLKIIERKKKPVLFPERAYEPQRIEDHRITKIEGAFYLAYSAYDTVNVGGGLCYFERLSKV